MEIGESDIIKNEAALWKVKCIFIYYNKCLIWIGHVDSKRKVSQIFNNNPQGSRLRGRPKTDGGIVYKQVLINAKLQIGMRGQKTEEVHLGDKGAQWTLMPLKK